MQWFYISYGNNKAHYLCLVWDTHVLVRVCSDSVWVRANSDYTCICHVYNRFVHVLLVIKLRPSPQIIFIFWIKTVDLYITYHIA